MDYYPGSMSAGGSLCRAAACVRSCIGGQRCDYTDS